MAQTKNDRKTTTYSRKPTALTSESKNQEIRSIGEIPGFFLAWRYSIEIADEKTDEIAYEKNPSGPYAWG